jgi:uncharacterized protein (TIRG00374 family)
VRRLLQLVVSLVLLALVVWWAGPAKLLHALRDADLPWLAPAAVLLTAVTVVHGVRWWVLLRPVGRIPLRDAVLALMVAKAVGVVVPLRAGAVVQVQVLGRRYALDRGAVAGTLVLEAVIDASCFLALFIVAAPFIGGGPALTAGIWLMTAVVVVAQGVMMLLARRRDVRSANADDRGILARVHRTADSVRAGFDAVRNPWAVAAAAALTFLDWLLASLGYALVGRAFGLSVSPVVYLLVEVVGNLAGAVPFTQSGIGPYEVAVAQLLARRGETLDLSTAYAVGAHALGLLMTLLSGGAALVSLGLRPGEVFYLHHVAREPAAGSRQPDIET